jgi:DNA-binding transcriptional LysR family regulator
MRKRSVGLADLTGHPLILPGPDSSVRRLVDMAFGSMGLTVTPAYEVSLMSTVAGMVRAGLGAAILPTAALDMGELAGPRSRPLREPIPAREIGVLLRSGRSLSPAAGSFLEAVMGNAGILALKNSATSQRKSDSLTFLV